MMDPHHRFSFRNRWGFIAAFCAAVVGTAPLHAQFGGLGNSANTTDDKSTPPGVSVPDSPGASERLDKARDKENQKQWKTAAEYYQEALSKYPGRVVAVNRNPDKGIYQYEGIAPVVQERLAKWPAEGVRIYDQMYGQTAADLLSAAPRGDIAALGQIFWTYFITDAGKSAGIQLLDAYLESGDFRAAAWTGERLLTLHPALGADRSMIIYRTALAYDYSSDTANSQRLLATLKQSGANDVGTIGGKDVVLADSLASIVSAAPIEPTTRPWDADTYPSFGGRGQRGEFSRSTDNEPRAALASVQLTPPDFNGVMGGGSQPFKANDETSIASHFAMGIMPVVDAGTLFFQDGRCVYAVDEDTGVPLPGWLNTYGPERAGRYKISVFGRARSQLLTVTVTPSGVLAIMGQRDPMVNGVSNANFGMQVQIPQSSSTVRLVCLDRDSGRELWTRTPAELPDSLVALHTGEYSGTPLYLPAAIAGRIAGSSAPPEDCVLVVAHGGTENQFDDCYVVCLSLKTGQYRWSTYVGSATRNLDFEGMSDTEPSQMSLADGRVFVMTNLGNVAALDPSDGRVLWLDSYQRDNSDIPEVMFLRGGGRRWGGQMPNAANPSKPWAHNPVFVDGGYVFVLPNDCKQLFIYDENTGVEQQRLPMSAMDDSDVVLGVKHGILYTTSEKGVFAIDWKKFNPDRPGSFTLWKEDLIFGGRSGKPDPEPNTVCGRGFLTADSVFVPTRFRLVQCSQKSRRIVEIYPASGSFTGTQGPGNVLVTARNVVVAGQTEVEIFANLDRVRQRFDQAIAAAPNDPQPRMDYAEALFSGGQTADAIAHVDDAIKVIGGLSAMRSGKERAMIFLKALDFADRSAKGADPNTTARTIADTNAFFDRATAAADSPAEKATCRLDRAKFEHEIGDLAGEVKLCQDVLSDDAMRQAVLENDVSAADSAETAINVACSMDHSVYRDIEQRAQDALKSAMEAGDPQQLLMVATVYPNSKAAVNARQEAVQRFEAANQPDKAIAVLRRIYLGTSDPYDRANLLVSIANDFLTSPSGVGPALDRLCRAARISQTAKIGQKVRLPDGTTLNDISYADAIETLRRMQAEQDTAALPDFHLAIPTRGAISPFEPGQAPIISNVSTVVHPLRGFNRNDQILTWSPAGLCIYPLGQTTPLATVPGVDKQPLQGAWTHDEWVIWTKQSVYAIGGDGKLVWSFSLAGLPAMVVTSGRETAINEAGDDTGPTQGGFVRVNGQLIPLPPGGMPPGGFVNIQRLRRGQLQIVQPQPPVVIHTGVEEVADTVPAGPAGAQLLVSTSTGRIVALDARNGQIVWQIRPSDHAVDELLANAHFTVTRIDDPIGSLIAVFDTATGRVIGRRSYGAENTNTQRQLVNVALSEEATLAVTLQTQVMVKDLYDPWKAPFSELVAQANRDNAPYVGLNQSDQLLIRGGRLVCVYDSGQYVRGYDLSRSGDPTNPLATEADSVAVNLQLVGPRVFIVTSNGMHQYNLAEAGYYPQGSGSGDHYEQEGDGMTGFPPKVRGMFVGKDYAIVVNDAVDRGPLGSPLTVLVAFRRALVPGKTRESGNVAWNPSISSPIGITDWLCSDGAVYYLTRDNNLHVLRGSRP